MTCSTRTRNVLVVALALGTACGSETGGDELPDGAFTTGPSGDTDPGEASAADDPSVTMSATTPTEASVGEESSSDTTATTSTSSTSSTSSETTSPITADESTTETTDPTTETTDPTTETTDPTTETTGRTTDPTTDATTDTGPMPSCGDGAPDLGELCLQPPQSYSMGLSPADIVLGDFDSDGNLDVATANAAEDTVSVRLGNGDGTFAAETVHAVGTEPVALEIGRFDAGTDDDLVVVNRGSNDVSILLSDGAGGFAAATSEPVGTTPVDVSVVSVDNLVDSDDDLVVLNQGSADYTVLLSNADGTFTVPLASPFSAGVAMPTTILAQSYNSVTDANTDVFTFGGTSFCGDPGDGLGSRTAACPAAGVVGGANIVRAVATRFDAGVTWDIALVEDMNDRVLFLPGNGGAGFQQIAATVAEDPSDLVAIDMNDDDIQDAVVAHRGDDSVGLVAFDGDSFDNPVVFPTGMGPTGIEAADLDGDTIADVVTSNGDGDDISVLLSNP